MSFQSEEQTRLKTFAERHWGIKSYVLPDDLACENLDGTIRADALAYFDRCGIQWWNSEAEQQRRPKGRALPTGSLISSQVACVNHLHPTRCDKTLALAVARRIERDVQDVLPVEDDGFIAYEWIGAENYLGETATRSRGAYVTSIDALMLVRRASGRLCLLVFEWKYLERYDAKSVAKSVRGTDRVTTYAPLISAKDGPIVVDRPEALFFEPYCQLMRQTLLGWQMAKAGELGADDWIHVHVIPENNHALRNRVPNCAPELNGETMAEAWRSVLKEPARYRVMNPTEVLPAAVPPEWIAWRTWLEERYHT